MFSQRYQLEKPQSTSALSERIGLSSALKFQEEPKSSVNVMSISTK